MLTSMSCLLIVSKFEKITLSEIWNSLKIEHTSMEQPIKLLGGEWAKDISNELGFYEFTMGVRLYTFFPRRCI